MVDLKLPKESVKGRGRPKGAPNKPRTTTRDPSAFEVLEKKRKKKAKVEKEETPRKKAKVEEVAPKKKIEDMDPKKKF